MLSGPTRQGWCCMARGSGHSADSRRYFDWLFHASQDYLAARLLREDERCFSAAAFHCQQCIEKALKGYLLFHSRRLFDGHNLTWLCKQAVQRDETFQKWLAWSTSLNRYYIETRYPADLPLDIDTGSIDTILRATGDMLDFICGQIRFDFQSYHKRKGQRPEKSPSSQKDG